ncbi:hypothetical protein [Amycolatopsis benzoatilytica]|uniref:hypothetical protein n=1 Tax=Amycolatopsis benzoatilytica TaxID=346045 RepID=UPI0003716FC9|nr:hypothetical protein [Amycolatopsis benzoatilytica]
MSAQILPLNHRERATLTAVAHGRAEMTCSCEPDLYIDGVPCCDQFTAHRLARLALVVPQRSGRRGERVPALLTAAGLAAINLPAADLPQSAA